MARKVQPLHDYSPEPGGTSISPPRQLGEHGLALWNSVMAEYRIEDRGGIELLAQACTALDRAESLAQAVARDGDTAVSKGGLPKVHPGIREEMNCRAFVCRVLERLGLNVEAVRPQGRPGRPSGWTPFA